MKHKNSPSLWLPGGGGRANEQTICDTNIRSANMRSYNAHLWRGRRRGRRKMGGVKESESESETETETETQRERKREGEK
jgi:hypothetical protein